MTTATLRARAQAILCDAYGASGWTIASGHFHREAADVSREGEESLNVGERAVSVVLGQRTALDQPTNPLNGYGLFRYPMAVVVGYVVTGAGGDDPERAGPMSGAATVDAVEDRSQTDRHLIESAVGYFGNWAGLDPAVIDCRPTGEGGFTTQGDERASLSVGFDLWARAAIPGAYGPTL